MLRDVCGDEECWGSGGEAEEGRLAWWALAKNWYAIKEVTRPGVSKPVVVEQI